MMVSATSASDLELEQISVSVNQPASDESEENRYSGYVISIKVDHK